MIRHMISAIVLIANIGIGFHAVMDGSYLTAAVCAVFGTLCFIDLKEGV